jgi:hypothetical protein
MADFDTNWWIKRARARGLSGVGAWNERTELDRLFGTAHGGKVTASEHVALAYDFSKMTAEEAIGYIKGSG